MIIKPLGVTADNRSRSPHPLPRASPRPTGRRRRHQRGTRALRLVPPARRRVPRGSLRAVARRTPEADRRHARELIPHDDLAFYEADEATAQLWGVFARGHYAEEVIADEPFGFGEGITGWAVANREPVLANRADLDPRVKFVEGTPPDPEALIAVPLIARGSIKGALNIYRVGIGEFTEEEFRLAVRFGDAAALALDNAHARASLELQAQTDPLTGLWNHRSFHERLRNEIVRVSTEQASSVALLMLDLDDFKRVNDIYGHAVGDQVLAELATQLRSVVRETDDVCRTGGEEFAIIVRAGDLAAAHALADRVARRVAEANFYQAGPITLSIGIALGPEHAANPRKLIACAEIAMMTAKARGKSRIVVFDADESERPVTDATRSEDLRSIAHLKMLHGVSTKLSRLLEIEEIAATIADELRQLIDYHNCRVYLRDGDDLTPVAFRGAPHGYDRARRSMCSRSRSESASRGTLRRRVRRSSPATRRTAASAITSRAPLGSRSPCSRFRCGTAPTSSACSCCRSSASTSSTATTSASSRCWPGMPRSRSRTHASMKRSGERHTGRKRSSSSRGSSRPAPSWTRSPSGSCAAPFGFSMFRRASLWLPLDDDAGLACLSRWPDDEDPAHAQPGDRLAPRALQLLANRTEPFLIRSEDHLETIGPDFNRTLAAAYALAPFPIEGSHGGIALTLAPGETLDGGDSTCLRASPLRRSWP